jgi:hypothetical protein
MSLSTAAKQSTRSRLQGTWVIKFAVTEQSPCGQACKFCVPDKPGLVPRSLPTPARLSSWNLPYAAYSKALGKRPGQPSPFGATASTPAYLNIDSPDPVTPGRPAAAPSPAMQLVREKVAQDRSNLFLQGRHQDLLASCGKEDRV